MTGEPFTAINIAAINIAAINIAAINIAAIDILVLAAMACALAFVVAWAISPALRVRIERPKYRFQERLRGE